MANGRFTDEHVSTWREQGFVLIEDFFSAQEIESVVDDYDTLYGERAPADGRARNFKQPGAIGAVHPKQFLNFDQLPYDASAATNLLSLHPALIEFARALLGVADVHCYQSHSWAKFTGEADFDQAFHCDFGNHTLAVPADDVALRTVDFIIYLTDVTDDLGALHYVTKLDAADVLGADTLVVPDAMQTELLARERSAAAPAGALLAHGIDTLHRGTNLTREGGRRYTMTTGYKAAGNDLIGFHVWQFAPDRPWGQVLNHATPEQLAALGIPPPGHTFWTEQALRRTAARWPQWDLTPWHAACNERTAR